LITLRYLRNLRRKSAKSRLFLRSQITAYLSADYAEETNKFVTTGKDAKARTRELLIC
jgi:hypothetical protein